MKHGRPTGTAVRFALSLDFERQLGLAHWYDEAPRMDGLKVTVCSRPAKPIITLIGRFKVQPVAIDLRLQSFQWMNDFEKAGGRLVLEKVTTERIDDIARDNDLTVVATGKEGGALFRRDAERSPSDTPLRHLAMVNCEGPSMRFSDLPFTAAKFTIFEGLGECYWTPYYHKDGKPLWNLVFEAKPGTPYDCFQKAGSGEEVLAIGKDVIRKMMPWDVDWIETATLADENSWLVGSITPTVRDPVAATLGGHRVIPLGDAYIAYDPLGAQGANIGNRLARVLVEAIVARKDEAFDETWVRGTYEPFFHRWGEPAIRWTHFLLAPMRLPARYFFLTQQGSDGVHTLGTPKQELADAFAANFDDPIQLVNKLRDFSRTRHWVLDAMGPAGDWEAAKGLAAVIRRQLQ